MGASLQTIKVKTSIRKDVKKAFKQQKKDDIYNYGNSCYSGTFGTLEDLDFYHREVDSYATAKDIIADNTEKWGNALAVPVKEGSEFYYVVGGWCAE